MRTLPFLVSRTRSLVPLCVFSFGMVAGAPYDEIQLFAGELRGLIDRDGVAVTADNFLCKFEPDVLVGEFPAAIEDGDLDFVSFLEKIGDFLEFDAQVMFADLQAETHLFHLGGPGSTLVFLELLGPLIIELSPVDNFGNRRVRIRRYFD